MKKIQITAITFAAVVLTILGGMAFAQQDKYTLKVLRARVLWSSRIRRLAGCCHQSERHLKLVAVILANPETSGRLVGISLATGAP